MEPTFFSLKSPKKKWDAIVVGSGMGGMTTAALLAKAGKQVLVLEQHYVPGGFTHSFKREHWEWDVGIHAIGEVTQYASIGRLLHHLTGGKLQWASLGSVYEQFFFPEGRRIDFPDTPPKFRANLLEAFPDEAKAIDTFLAETKKVALGMRKYFVGRCLPAQWGKRYDQLTHSNKYFLRTTQSVLNSITDNPKLKTVFAAQWGYHGATPSRSSFAMQALVTRHYAYGAFYPIGGAGQVAKALLTTVAQSGGWTRIRSGVKQINFDGNKATGVTLQNGETIDASIVVSAVGARETVERLLPDQVPALEKWRNSFQKLPPSPCHICLHLGFEGDIRQAGASGANQWFWETWDCEKGTWNFQETKGPPPVLYTSYPSLKDPQHGSSPFHTGEVVTFVPYDAFEKFRGSRTQKRGEEYETLKKELSDRILAQLFKFMPGLREHLRYTELSTPLSTEHYTRSFAGAIYGLEPTPERFANASLRPRTPVKNFFLSGSDVGTAGVIGAMVGGVLSAVCISPIKVGKFVAQSTSKKVIEENSPTTSLNIPLHQ